MPNQYALVIGIENYPESSGQKKVRYALNDCTAVADYFEKCAGFELDDLVLYEKATHEGIVDAVDHFFDYVTPEQDWVAIYMAGHGHYSPYGGFFVPYSFKSGSNVNESTCVPFELIHKRIRAKNPKKLIFLLDACHSGLASGDADFSRDTNSDERAVGIAASRAEKEFEELAASGDGVARVLFASCAPDERSYHDDGFRHGVFTHFLLQGLSGKAPVENGAVNIETLIPWVRKRVVDNRQAQSVGAVFEK